MHTVKVRRDTFFNIRSAISAYHRRFERQFFVIRRFHRKLRYLVVHFQFRFIDVPAEFQKSNILIFQRFLRHIQDRRGNDIFVGLFLDTIQIIHAQTVFEIVVSRILFIRSEIRKILFAEILFHNVRMIMLAIIFDEENCIFARIHACILRTCKVVVKLLQNSAVIHFFIQSPVIFLTEIVIFAAKRIEEFRFNMNLVVALENLFRRLTHKICFELFKFFFDTVYYKLFVIRRFHGNRLVYRLIARLF